MNESEIQKIKEKQHKFFAAGKTLSVSFRLKALDRLARAIRRMEPEILSALNSDLGKSSAESFMCEIGMVLSEISYLKKHLPFLAKAKPVPTPLAQFPSLSYRTPVPYGNVLIISPWNYPIMLTLEPLVDALAAGNTAILKPSAYSPESSAVLETLIGCCFPQEYVAVIQGGREENSHLLRQKFDYIFFTGSKAVGETVMTQAAANLTPVTLELGGKSPCFVDETANIPLAAKRIVFGKFLNCGQTCVAPDYILCHESVKQQLISELKKQIILQYGRSPLDNPDYGKIVNEKHFYRLLSLIDQEKCVYGGTFCEDRMQIAPTILDGVSFKDPVMREEIFGPLLPVISYRHLKQAAALVNERPHPLACYIFSSHPQHIRYLQNRCQFGGGCINDTIIHLATSAMGFGGVGHSGMGSYHGKDGFDTFSHYKSMVDKKTWLDLPIRYQPYEGWKRQVMRMFLR